MIKKHILTYQGFIGPNKNSYLALERKLCDLVDQKKLDEQLQNPFPFLSKIPSY